MRRLLEHKGRSTGGSRIAKRKWPLSSHDFRKEIKRMKFEKMRTAGTNRNMARSVLGGGISEDTMKVWEQIKALPISEVLIIEPEKADGDALRLKTRLYSSLLKLVKVANFQGVLSGPQSGKALGHRKGSESEQVDRWKSASGCPSP